MADPNNQNELDIATTITVAYHFLRPCSIVENILYRVSKSSTSTMCIANRNNHNGSFKSSTQIINSYNQIKPKITLIILH